MSDQQQPQSRFFRQSSTETKASKRADVRSRRADEYERKGLENPEAFKACLAAIQANNIRIGFALGAAVEQALANQQNTPDKLKMMESSANLFLRVTRQIERFRQLEFRELQAEQKAAKMTAATSNRRSDGSGGEGSNKPR